jgi:hypothetical protein
MIMGASGDEGRHVKPEETSAEDQVEEKAADPAVKYPGGQTGATEGTTAGGDDEEQVKYPG